MEVVFWTIVAIIVLAVLYVCAQSFRKRKKAVERDLPCPTSRPTQKDTGLICRREEKPMTTLPERVERLGFAAGQPKAILLRTPLPHPQSGLTRSRVARTGRSRP
jgi:hypothetical protein